MPLTRKQRALAKLKAQAIKEGWSEEDWAFIVDYCYGNLKDLRDALKFRRERTGK